MEWSGFVKPVELLSLKVKPLLSKMGIYLLDYTGLVRV